MVEATALFSYVGFRENGDFVRELKGPYTFLIEMLQQPKYLLRKMPEGMDHVGSG